VRLDALSDKEIIDPQGNKTTSKKWLEKRNISYRPAVLLYSEGKEIEKLTGLLKSFHFQQLLKFVEGHHYTKFDTWIGYVNEQSNKLLKSGQNIDIWE
jgi:thioredoxin-related protein